MTERQPVNRYFGTGQLHCNLALQFLEGLHIPCFQFYEYGAVKQRLFVFTEIGQQFYHVLQIALRLNCFIDVVTAAFQLVAAGGVLNDFALFHRFDQPVVNADGHAIPIRKLGQERLFLREWRIFPDYPHAPIAVAYDIVVG